MKTQLLPNSFKESKSAFKIARRLPETVQLLGVPYKADHSLIKIGKGIFIHSRQLFGIPKLGVELFVDSRVKVQT